MQPNALNVALGEVTEHLRLWRKETREELAALLGMSVKSLNRRISGDVPWEAWEIQTIADHYRVPIQRIYGGVDRLFGVEREDGITPNMGENAGVMLDDDESFWDASRAYLAAAV